MLLRAVGRWRLVVALLILPGLLVASPASETHRQDVLQSDPQAAPSHFHSTAITTDSHTLQNLQDALSVMQQRYFSLWLGQWTTAIDWTAAVTGTHLAATLSTLSHSLSYTMPGTFDQTRSLDVEAQVIESEINKYFGHIITYYFGQDHFSIRMQAYDDMLWVVLGWLEAIRLIKTHSRRHYPDSGDGGRAWHAQQFIPTFAHRVRVFYELAEEGWDWELCGGGMTWNPRLLPYKNAITNQLYISASINMYLRFPGDDNCSPFMGAVEERHPEWNPLYRKEQEPAFACSESDDDPEYDPLYLSNAIDGYEWLANSGMLNDQGLYTDGFHISGYAQNHSKTECDERNEMVYTYNQGVILSGLRDLWEATGNLSYLNDGHELVGNVIRATDWTDTKVTFVSFTPPSSPTISKKSSEPTAPRSILGTKGILTELCDPSSTCSQDSQTFKGIFFHHLTAFCTPLPTSPTKRGKTHHATHETYALHRKSCKEYAPWVAHNARAALETRDENGKFGSWWGAAYGEEEEEDQVLPKDALDYRNDPALIGSANFSSNPGDKILETIRKRSWVEGDDPNDRGRGRTVETQGAGVAVVRAMWEFLRQSGGYDDELVSAGL